MSDDSVCPGCKRNLHCKAPLLCACARHGHRRFDGADYVPARDDERLGDQYTDIFRLMSDEHWRSLPDIESETGHPPASISAQLRHMRKARFGSHTVNRRHIKNGLYEYQLIVNRRD